MAFRHYIAPIVGSGTQADPYRAKLPAGVEYFNVIPSDAAGHPLFPWTLVLVNGTSLAAVDADTALDPLPAVSLDTTLGSALTTAQRSALLTKLTSRGIATTGLSTTSTLGAVLTRIGTTLESAFQLEALGRPGLAQ